MLSNLKRWALGRSRRLPAAGALVKAAKPLLPFALPMALPCVTALPVAGAACRLVWCFDDGCQCCNRCCQRYQADQQMCRLIPFRSARAECYRQANENWQRCKLQCALDYPEYNTNCDRM